MHTGSSRGEIGFPVALPYIILQYAIWAGVTLGILSFYINLAYVLRVLTERAACFPAASQSQHCGILLNIGPLLLFTTSSNICVALSHRVKAAEITVHEENRYPFPSHPFPFFRLEVLASLSSSPLEDQVLCKEI